MGVLNYCRKNRIPASTSGWSAICSWLLSQPSLQGVSVHPVHPACILTHALSRAVSTPYSHVINPISFISLAPGLLLQTPIADLSSFFLMPGTAVMNSWDMYQCWQTRHLHSSPRWMRWQCSICLTQKPPEFLWFIQPSGGTITPGTGYSKMLSMRVPFLTSVSFSLWNKPTKRLWTILS